MKDTGLHIRVQRNLREKSLEVCRAQDKPAAQAPREFMHGYMAQHDASVRYTIEDSADISLDCTGADNRPK